MRKNCKASHDPDRKIQISWAGKAVFRQNDDNLIILKHKAPARKVLSVMWAHFSRWWHASLTHNIHIRQISPCTTSNNWLRLSIESVELHTVRYLTLIRTFYFYRLEKGDIIVFFRLQCDRSRDKREFKTNKWFIVWYVCFRVSWRVVLLLNSFEMPKIVFTKKCVKLCYCRTHPWPGSTLIHDSLSVSNKPCWFGHHAEFFFSSHCLTLFGAVKVAMAHYRGAFFTSPSQFSLSHSLCRLSLIWQWW